MKNATLTTLFLNSLDAKVKNEILSNIASHYGISTSEAYEEVTHEEAESIMDYVTGPTRKAVSAFYQMFTYQMKNS